MQNRVVILCFILGIICIVILSFENSPVSAQTATVTVALTPSSQSTPSPTITAPPSPTIAPSLSSSPTLTFNDAISAYEKIASQAIQTSDRVLDIAKWILGSVITLVAVFVTISGSVIAYLVRKAQSAGDVAKNAMEEAKAAAASAKISSTAFEMLSQKTETQSQEAQIQIGKARAQLEELERINAIAQNEYKQNTTDMKQWRQAYKHDLENLRSTLLLVQVEELNIAIYGDDPSEKWRSIQALIAMTDPAQKNFIRFRSIKILGDFLLYEKDTQIIERLRQIAANDTSIAIQRVAQNVINQVEN